MQEMLAVRVGGRALCASNRGKLTSSAALPLMLESWELILQCEFKTVTKCDIPIFEAQIPAR